MGRTRRSVRLWTRRLLEEKPHEVVPREWIIGGVLASLAALAMGITIGRDYWINMLASVTLLGPGLVLTNFVANNWRVNRQWIQERDRLAETAMGIDMVIRQEVLVTVGSLLTEIGGSLPAPGPDDETAFRIRPSRCMQQLYTDLNEAMSLVMRAMSDQRDAPPAWSEVDLRSFPEAFIRLEPLVASLDGKIHMATAKLMFERWRQTTETQTFIWNYDEDGESTTIAQTLDRMEAEVDASSALHGMGLVLWGASRFAGALTLAFAEREPR